MSALEQSLDAIISQNKTPRAKPTKRNNPVKTGKKVQVASKKFANKPRTLNGRPRPTGPAASRNVAVATKAKINNIQNRAIRATSLDVATKVIVSGLPKDINQEAIREFFNQSVGGVAKLTLSFNAQGKSTGVATVIFKSATAAHRAVQKYNNSPIDNGRSNLKLELVVDTTKVPLASRIQPNVQPNPMKNRVQVGRNANVNPNANRGKPVKPAKPARVAAKVRNAAPKKQPKKKKTIEELDQEMADYFASNN